MINRPEKCPCVRIVLTEQQARGHATHCDRFPEDLALLARDLLNANPED